LYYKYYSKHDISLDDSAGAPPAGTARQCFFRSGGNGSRSADRRAALPDQTRRIPFPLEAEPIAEVLEVDRATQLRMDRIAKSWKKTKNRQ
jgi:hypothetical protein